MSVGKTHMIIKNLLTMIALISLSSDLFASESTAAGSSVIDSEPLSKLLSVIGEVAADGPSLSYFGWSEAATSVSEDAKCYAANLHDATEYMVRLVDDLDWANPEQHTQIDNLLAKSLDDFREILGDGELRQCEWDVSEQMSLTKVTQFSNLQTGYQITFSLGFED